MKNLRQLLAYNMKKYRRGLGLSQARLAERAELSAQYIAMIELARKFPTPEMLERIAQALEIDPPELFSMPATEGRIKEFQKAVLIDLEKSLSGALSQAIERSLDKLETPEDYP